MTELKTETLSEELIKNGYEDGYLYYDVYYPDGSVEHHRIKVAEKDGGDYDWWEDYLKRQHPNATRVKILNRETIQ